MTTWLAWIAAAFLGPALRRRLPRSADLRSRAKVGPGLAYLSAIPLGTLFFAGAAGWGSMFALVLLGVAYGIGVLGAILLGEAAAEIARSRR